MNKFNRMEPPTNDKLEAFKQQVDGSIELVKTMSRVQQLEAIDIWKDAASALEQLISPNTDSLEPVEGFTFNVPNFASLFEGDEGLQQADCSSDPDHGQKTLTEKLTKSLKAKKTINKPGIAKVKTNDTKIRKRLSRSRNPVTERVEDSKPVSSTQSSLLDEALIQVAEPFLQTKAEKECSQSAKRKRKKSAASSNTGPRRSSRTIKPSKLYSDFVLIKDSVVGAHSGEKLEEQETVRTENDSKSQVKDNINHEVIDEVPEPADDVSNPMLTLDSTELSKSCSPTDDPLWDQETNEISTEKTSSSVTDVGLVQSKPLVDASMGETDDTRQEHIDHGYSSAPPDLEGHSPFIAGPGSAVLDVKVDTSGSTIVINICKHKPPIYQDGLCDEVVSSAPVPTTANTPKKKKATSEGENVHTSASSILELLQGNSSDAITKNTEKKRKNERGKDDAKKKMEKEERKGKEEMRTSGSCVCPECGKTATNQSNLKVHMRIHSGEKPYACPLCGKAFSTKPNMVRHQLTTHTKEKPWKCKVCHKGFSEKKSLTIHMRRHTGEKPYKCPHCEKSFSQTGTLQSHLHTHTGWKGHLCDFCGKSFRQKTQLKVHQNRHFGIRNHKCPICPKTFVAKGDMARHQLSHTGQRAFLCSSCPKTFTRLQYLREHTNVHTNTTPYHCKYCGEAFHDISSHGKHLKKHELQNDSLPAALVQRDETTNKMFIFYMDQNSCKQRSVISEIPSTDLNTLATVQEAEGSQYLSIPTMVKDERAENLPKVVDHVLDLDGPSSLPVLEIQGALAALQERHTMESSDINQIKSTIVLDSNAVVQGGPFPTQLQTLEVSSLDTEQTVGYTDLSQESVVTSVPSSDDNTNPAVTLVPGLCVIQDYEVPVGAETTSVCLTDVVTTPTSVELTNE